MSKNRRLPRSLEIYWLASIFLYYVGRGTAWVFFHKFRWYNYPYGEYLFPLRTRYTDFYCYMERFRYFHQAKFFTFPGQTFNYPAPVAFAYRLFYSPFFGLQAFRFCAKAAFAVAALMLVIALVRQRVHWATALAFVVPLLLVCYPIDLEIFLGNMELVVWVVFSIGICLYVRGQHTWASVCFGIAGAMKVYPIIMLGVPASQKKWKASVVGLSAAVLCFVGCTYLLGPTFPIALRGLSAGVKQFNARYVLRFNDFESGIDHSLFGIEKLGLFLTHHGNLIPQTAGPYLLIVAVAGVIVYLVRLRHLPEINQLVALTVASVLLPPVSHDYTLINLLAPWALIVLAIVRTGRATRTTLVALGCFALLFAPENILVLHGLRYAGAFKSLVLVVLFAAMCFKEAGHDELLLQ